jgi:SAM-dependent methyltransferase
VKNDFWNQRFSEPGYAYGTEPNAFLASNKQYLKPGMKAQTAPPCAAPLASIPSAKALAVADGEGRNGVWLAGQGLDVLSVDASEVGLRKTRELAQSRGLAIRTELVDLTTWNWPENEFDIVAAIFVHFPPDHRARMHEKMLHALKPGGVLIMEAFTPGQLKYKSGGPQAREMLYTAGMLREDYMGAEILLLEETPTDLNEGPYHRGKASVVRLVLRRDPSPQRL